MFVATAPALCSVRRDGRGMPASWVFTAFDARGAGTGVACGGGTGVAKDIEVYTHYGQRAGRLPGRLAAELVRGMLPRPGLTIPVTVWTNTTNTLRWMEASTASSQAAQKLATRGGPNRALPEPRPRRATCTDAGALTPRSVFVDDEDAADRRPAKVTSADLIPVGRTDATEGPRATVDYARPS
jgi:hypothetical protein